MTAASKRLPYLPSVKLEASNSATEVCIEDFWAWSVSDLVSNATRGILAEFVVAKALGIPCAGVRNEWAAYDLRTLFNITVEVKSAAYVQSWFQKDYSKIGFGVKATRAWNPVTNKPSDEPKRQAQVYVFALLHHKDQDSIDPIDLDQWAFYVLPTKVLDERTRSQHSITLKSLMAPADPGRFDDLNDEVNRAARRN